MFVLLRGKNKQPKQAWLRVEWLLALLVNQPFKFEGCTWFQTRLEPYLWGYALVVWPQLDSSAATLTYSNMLTTFISA